MKKIALLGCCVFVLGLLSCAFAEGSISPLRLAGIEFFTGYVKSNTSLQGDKGVWRAAPIAVDFDFDLKKLISRKTNIVWPGLVQLQVEPFFSYIYNPRANFEAGASVFLKIGFVPDTWIIQPYGKFGVGLDYMTLHTREQGTQFNFIDTISLGTHYVIKKNLALTVEYRLRHLSNAGIDERNSGINTHFALIGAAYQF